MDGTVPHDLYERDFYAWTQDQAARLRALDGRNDGLDAANVAEEIESLGRSDRRAAESLIGNLLLYLCKLRWHPDPLPRTHWTAEVIGFRRQVGRIFRDSPSLRAKRQEMAEEEWQALRRGMQITLDRARMAAGDVEAQIATTEALPFDLDAEVLSEDWFPDPPAA